jgi:hypothetical protein
MSVELRVVGDEIVCDWGAFGDPPLIQWNYETNTTTVENVAPLILVSRGFADNFATTPAKQAAAEVTAFYTAEGRRFMRITADNGSWVWELHEAHWDDGEKCSVYIGRWRD